MNLRVIILVCLVVVGAFLVVDHWPRSVLRSRDEGVDPLNANSARRARATDADGLDRLSPESFGLLQHLLDRLAAGDARKDEVVVTFSSREALAAFRERAKAAGLRLLGAIDALNAARIGYDSLADLQSDILDHYGDYAELDANFLMQLPGGVPRDARGVTNLVPLGNNLLKFLGVSADTSQWGRGVTLAIIDTAVANDPTFARGQVVTIDLGLGLAIMTADANGHGTAVAALAAGSAPDAQGVAPAVRLLNVPVTGADGLSDVFTVGHAIIAAVDAGAQIINVSLGTYQATETLLNAIKYAIARDAVVVASAGNEQAAQLTWPAADPRVVSVGAVDALQQQVPFSNSGEQLQIMAPGYGVQTAWTQSERVLLDGTSASAPIVAGAIAAVMSENPGTTPAAAWNIIRQYSAEAGAPGADPDYGNGVIDLGWAMARNDFTRVDTAIASHHFNAATGEVEFVVQNRSAIPISGLKLQIDIDGAAREAPLEPIQPGAISVTSVPIDPARLESGVPINLGTLLVNPPGTVDANPGNNARESTLTSAPPEG